MGITRRTALAGAGATAATVALAACNPAANRPLGTESGAAASQAGPVTLQFVESLTNPARTEVLKKLMADFTAKNPTIKVNMVSPPTEQADAKIQQMLQAGSGIDVFELRDNTVGAFANNKYIYDMTSDLQGWDGWDKLTPNTVKFSKSVDGKIYYIPYGFYGLSLFYRTDLIKEAGFSAPPATWEEMLTQASKIQDPTKNRYGYSFRGGKNSQGNVVAAIWAYVGDKVDPTNAFKTKDGGTIFAAPEAKAAVDSYFKLFKQASPPSSVAWGYPEMVEGFNNGSCAFLLQDPEVIATINASKSLKKDQWSTAPLLRGAGGKACQGIGTAGWGIAASSPNKKAAVELVKFLNGDASTVFAKENSLVPIQKSAGSDPFYSDGPWKSYVTMSADPATWIPVVGPYTVSWWSEWQGKGDADVQKVLVNKLTPVDLLADWDKWWTEKWKK